MIIVTGGAGLIGSAVVHGLNQRGIENIMVVDHLGLNQRDTGSDQANHLDYHLICPKITHFLRLEPLFYR